VTSGTDHIHLLGQGKSEMVNPNQTAIHSSFFHKLDQSMPCFCAMVTSFCFYG